jgi:hypothetical protein
MKFEDIRSSTLARSDRERAMAVATPRKDRQGMILVEILSNLVGNNTGRGT